MGCRRLEGFDLRTCCTTVQVTTKMMDLMKHPITLIGFKTPSPTLGTIDFKALDVSHGEHETKFQLRRDMPALAALENFPLKVSGGDGKC